MAFNLHKNKSKSEDEDYDYTQSHMSAEKGRSYAKSYHTDPWRLYTWQMEKAFLDHVLVSYFSGKRLNLLDFACGTGRILAYLYRKVNDAVGVDISESMLQEARRVVPNATILQADITENDVLGTRLFNLITAFRFFPNAQDTMRAEVIEILVRHLSDDGIIVFNNHRNASAIRFTLCKILGKRVKTMCHKEVHAMLSSAGLEVRAKSSHGVLPASHKRLLMPRPVHTLVDKACNAAGLGSRLGQNVVFACSRVNNGEIATSQQFCTVLPGLCSNA